MITVDEQTVERVAAAMWAVDNPDVEMHWADAVRFERMAEAALAELEAQVTKAREDALREAHNIVAAKARETDSADTRFDLASAGLQILALIDKEPKA